MSNYNTQTTPIAIRVNRVNMNLSTPKLQHTNTHATLGHVVYRHPDRNQSQHGHQTTTHKHTPTRVNMNVKLQHTNTHATLGHVVYRHECPDRNQSQHECQTTTHKHTQHATVGHVVYRHPDRNQSQHECQTTTHKHALHVVSTPDAIRVNMNKLQHTNTHATLGHVVYRHPHRNQSQHECQTTTHKHTCHSGPCSLSTPPSQSEST